MTDPKQPHAVFWVTALVVVALNARSRCSVPAALERAGTLMAG